MARIETDDTLAARPGAVTAPARPTGPRDDYTELVAIDPEHYVVGDEIARGGMGRILAARDRRLGRPVAIKELLHDSPDVRARFEREARITAKLQHPAIVNIHEAGAWPSGEPFYVMKLVAGESLDKVIGRSKFEARLGLLPNVIAVIDALAYAHSRRVIHRDLKPANVLVGEFGETVVIDWGLAKDLADPNAEVSLAPVRPTPGASGEATVAGSVMGTPAYMPAEQALGELVDERADVYSLGAMLYHLLAGAPPYTGKTTEDILARVITGPPPPLESRQLGIPPDLVTIVNKAMAHAPGQRYPTAKELADDLKKFQTGQLVGAHDYSTWQLVRRWVRRNRKAVTVAGVAVVLLATLAVVSVRRIVREQVRTEEQRVAAQEQRKIAEDQRQVAERNRSDAESLMNFMMVDLRGTLAPLGKLALLDPMARKAIAYYAGRPDAGSDEDLRNRAMAHANIGDVLLPEGDLAGALVEYEQAQMIRERLATAAPANLDRQRELAFVYDRIGDVHLAQRDTPRALGVYRASLAINERLAAADATDANLRDVSVGYNKVGDVLVASGDPTGALAQFRAALTIREKLAAKAPTSVDRQRDLSASYDRVGDLLQERDPAAALVMYSQSLAIAQQLATRDPTSARQRDLSTSFDRIGDVLVTKSDPDGALAAYRASLAIRQKLVASDPTNAGWLRDLSLSYDAIGDVLAGRSDPRSWTDALAMYERSLGIAKSLAAKDPTNAAWQRDLAASHANVGDVRLLQGDAVAAVTQYTASRTLRDALAARDTSNTVWQRDLAIIREKLGDAVRATRDLPAAREHYRASLAIREALAAKDPASAKAATGLRAKLGGIR